MAGADRRSDRPAGRQHARRPARRAALGDLQPRRTTLDGFAVDCGTWEVSSNALQVGASSIHGDAAAVYNIPEYLPVYFEVLASISVIKPIAGWKANAYIIFDYQDPTHFKFAGHRHLDQQARDGPPRRHRMGRRRADAVPGQARQVPQHAPHRQRAHGNAGREQLVRVQPHLRAAGSRWLLVRPELRLHRLRLRQLARQLRQPRGPGAAPGDHVRPGRGLRRRRCPAVQRNAERHVHDRRRRLRHHAERHRRFTRHDRPRHRTWPQPGFLPRDLDDGPRGRDRRRAVRRVQDQRLQVRRARRRRTARRSSGT